MIEEEEKVVDGVAEIELVEGRFDFVEETEESAEEVVKEAELFSNGRS